jgi:predicted DsbA family dithiol-disulfide isomerase
MAQPLPIHHFTDVLCVWAYTCQVRIDELAQAEGDAISIERRFCSVFADASDRLSKSWADRGGLAGYAKHVQSVVARFDHLTISDKAWAEVAPRSSLGAHIFLSAIRHLEGDVVPSGTFAEACWAFRTAFFAEGRDIGQRSVQYEVAEQLELPIAAIEDCLADSSAHAELAADFDLAKKLDVSVSPTLVLNEGRQRLAGNVGYRVIAANVHELLRGPAGDDASWC